MKQVSKIKKVIQDSRFKILAGLFVWAVPVAAFAQTNPFEAQELTLPVIVVFGLLDSINPCVIGVLLLMLTVLMKAGDKRAVLRNGTAYTIGVYLTYLIGGLTLLGLFNAIREIEVLSRYLYVTIGGFVILAGVLEVKDFFWYGRWFSLQIPHRFIATIENRVVNTHASLIAAASFGIVVTLIELPCTGAPYLAILTLMSQQGLGLVKALPLLLFYNLIFIAPLIVIIGMVYKGVEIKRFQSWKTEHRGTMRLAIGYVLFAVGVWIVTAVDESLFGVNLFPPLAIGLVGLTLFMALLKYVFGYGRDWEAV